MYFKILNMRYIGREMEAAVRRAAANFPAVVITGPRRAGKTVMLKHLFPKAQFVLLEDPDLRMRVRSDARTFLNELRPPVILDEIQNAPELFDYIRARIDQAPRKYGQWLFTGSQEAPLMKGVTESMAGRAALYNLLPMSVRETDRVSLLLGGYPEVLAKPGMRDEWFASYIQTYLERDVRALTNVRDLPAYRCFLSILASHHGQVLNKTDLAAPLGVTVPTITQWMHILEVTGQLLIVPPYFENFGKRLLKSPKIYLGDPGLVCHLLSIGTERVLERSPFLGPIFEGFVASEIVKAQVNGGGRKELYYFRDQQGLEVDFLVPRPNAQAWMVECKATRTVKPAMTRPLLELGQTSRVPSRRILVHRRAADALPFRALSGGVEAMTVEEFAAELGGHRRGQRVSNL